MKKVGSMYLHLEALLFHEAVISLNEKFMQTIEIFIKELIIRLFNVYQTNKQYELNKISSVLLS